MPWTRWWLSLNISSLRPFVNRCSNKENDYAVCAAFISAFPGWTEAAGGTVLSTHKYAYATQGPSWYFIPKYDTSFGQSVGIIVELMSLNKLRSLPSEIYYKNTPATIEGRRHTQMHDDRADSIIRKGRPCSLPANVMHRRQEVYYLLSTCAKSNKITTVMRNLPMRTVMQHFALGMRIEPNVSILRHGDSWHYGNTVYCRENSTQLRQLWSE